MLTDLLLARALLRPRLDLEAAGRITCWWRAWRKRWLV